MATLKAFGAGNLYLIIVFLFYFIFNLFIYIRSANLLFYSKKYSIVSKHTFSSDAFFLVDFLSM